jgi:hypothetical protein
MPEEIVGGIASLFSSIGGAAGSAVSAIGSALPAGTGAAVAGSAASAVAGAGISKLLAPKLPGVRPPTPIPDQSAIDEARQRSLVLQSQRAGRDSTILTQGNNDTLG